MNRRVWIAALILLSLPAAGQSQEAYAPKIKVPDAVKDDPEAGIEVMMINMTEVPARSAVEQPHYPGAFVLQALPASEMEINEDRFETLAIIRLLTTDEPAKVLEFYKEKLEGWTYGEGWGGMFQYLYNGDGEFDPMAKSGRVTASVVITDAEDMYKVMPDAKTEITIAYK